MGHRLGPLCAVLAVTFAACGLARGDPVVDTWPAGAAWACAEDAATRCQALIAAGLRGLDDRDRGHPPVASATLHAEGADYDRQTGAMILMQRSGGCCQVLVVRFADGSQAAIGVAFPGVSRTAIAIPWECLPDTTRYSPPPSEAC